MNFFEHIYNHTHSAELNRSNTLFKVCDLILVVSFVSIFISDLVLPFYFRWTFAQNQKYTYPSVLHSHTVLMKVCPCGGYRQLNLVLYPNNHILKLLKIIFNGLVLKYI